MPEQQQQTDVEKLVGELELGVDRLRSLYEQYFMGIEKIEPLVPRKDVDRRIHVLRKEQIRNTALRFRFQMILQRYNTYQTHWQRICREIENGTYKRHVARANKRFGSEQERRSNPPLRRSSLPPQPEVAPQASARPPSVAPPARAPAQRLPPPAPAGFPQPGAAVSAHLAAELAELEREFGPMAGAPIRPLAPAAQRAPSPAQAPAPIAPPPRPPVARPAVQPPLAAKVAPQGAPPVGTPAAPSAVARPQVAPAMDLSEQRVRTLYQQYVDAKRRQNESTAALTYDGVAKSLRDSSAKLREKHGKAVDFEVAIRDGKAILKPVLK